jgi:hypothetical protein
MGRCSRHVEVGNLDVPVQAITYSRGYLSCVDRFVTKLLENTGWQHSEMFVMARTRRILKRRTTMRKFRDSIVGHALVSLLVTVGE